MEHPELISRRSNRIRAILSFGAIALGVGGWLYAARIVPDAEAARASNSVPAEVSGFRADLFFLPDEELLGFVEVAAGPFLMGSDPAADPQAFENERWGEDGRPGTIDLPTYFIGRYEVTVAQYREFVRATGRPVADTLALAGRSDHPVASVSWPDAFASGRWIERSLRESPTTPAALRELLDAGWRITLPTEAQWEKAARGTDGRIYPWGNEPRRDRANFMALTPQPVGSFDCPECPYGLADMSGNVWELTRSPFQPLPYDEADDRLDLATDALWVMRGGAYNDPAPLVRAAVRGGADPGARRPFIGFRLVLTRD
ncbi:MAG TPA: SUMF1/EgtB/PvdO family nonheme iron enzyme [Longimicrobiaceae bacterium]|nr:SUMF1/EgtB/PvdO family nonheme iron enzyme [Longimicrobiaceae bacterium]